MSILRNLAEDEEGVDYVFESIDKETLANCITSGLESSNEDVTHHVILNFIPLGNLH
jgi:armadillo repeat-containing protein 8